MIERVARLPCPAAVIHPTIAPGRRVLAISDIHGNLPFLKGVLAKARYSPDDVLVLVGDLFEKGSESLGVLRYVMELQKTRTVYPLCGNCDHLDRVLLNGTPESDRAIWKVNWWRTEKALPVQMGLELGLKIPRKVEDLSVLRRALWKNYPKECNFLCKLPQILEAGNFIFVHGGISREDRLDEEDAYGCMKFDDFLSCNLSFRRWVVVGHWPVTLYRTAYPSAAPLVLPDRHIISIDGGCVLKIDGQLNALLIPDITGDEVDCVAYDGLPQVRALDPQEASTDSINIRWSDSRVEKLREEGDCAWCRHLSTGRELWLPSKWLHIRNADGALCTEDATDYCLPVEQGDVISLVLTCCKGHLVKKDGVSGWYLGRIEPI